jgi:arginine decarboxylase
MNLFASGYLPLDQRSSVENLYWAICRKIAKMAKQLEFMPEELEGLEATLSDTYFCNFSLFQSMPDSWAIKQLFPVMPIHRLNERPTHNAVLGDVTCDSDGKIDQFIDRRDVKRTLPLHAWQNEPYYLGAFLIGAYQEILGDLHNLFGDTNAVHVSTDERGEVVSMPSSRETLSGRCSTTWSSTPTSWCNDCGPRSSRRSATVGSATARRAGS